MLGIIIQLFISYLIIRWTEHENLSFLGLYPNRKRISQFLVFLLIAGACSSVTFFFRMIFAGEQWMLNPKFSLKLLTNGIWYHVKSVLFEELIFRGVIFYLLIKKWGSKKAILISSAAFGIYHWFSYEVFNNPIQMLWIFLITGAAGVIYALGYVRTRTILIPIAMHFGWNFVNAFVFSNGNTGPGILVEKLPAPQVQVSYFIYFLVAYVHFILFFLLNFLMLKKLKWT